MVEGKLQLYFDSVSKDTPQLSRGFNKAVETLSMNEKLAFLNVRNKLFYLHPKIKENIDGSRILYRINNQKIGELRYKLVNGKYFLYLFLWLPLQTNTDILQIGRMRILTRDFISGNPVHSRFGYQPRGNRKFARCKYENFLLESNLPSNNSVKNLTDFAIDILSTKIK